MRLQNFFAELKRRNVIRMAGLYLVGAWLLVQVAGTVLPMFGAPDWLPRSIVILLTIGLLPALIFSWVFEMTPQGLKRDEDVKPEESIAPQTARRMNRMIIAVLLLALGYFAVDKFVLAPRRAMVPNGSLSVASAKSIAVLPFENLSDDKANAYFAEGIQDEILTKLAAVRDLKVISRTSTAKYQSNPDNLKKVANELGVSTVVEGAVQKAGDKVRVNVQLIDARVDTHLWAKSYDRDLKDVFAVESEVAQEISDALRAKLSPSEANAVAAAATRDPEAYDFFLKGEHEEHQAESTLVAEFFDRAEDLYRQALSQDPNFAVASARLAYSRLYRHWFINPLTERQLTETKSILDRALAISPESPDVHLTMGVYYYWGYRDYDPASREFDRAIQLQPNNSVAWGYRAAIYRRRGDWERSLADYRRAAEVNPRDPLVPANIGGTYNSLRRWNEAERELTRALDLDSHNTLAARALAITYVNSGADISRARQAFAGVVADNKGYFWGDIAAMVDERVYLDVIEKHFTAALKAWEQPLSNTAEERWRQLAARIGIQVIAGHGLVVKSECEQARILLETRLAEQPEDFRAMTALAWVYVGLGRNEDARRVSRQATESLSIDKDALSGSNLLAALAQIEARTGQPEEAVKIIRHLLAIPAGQVISIARLKIDPVWDPIRDHPDFQQLLSGPEHIGLSK
jgi:TolB-like protein/Tfp pilus assembly protein PilF